MTSFLKDIFGVLKTFGIIDLVDIIVVAFIIYYAIILARETRAMQLIKSIGVILLTYFIASNLHMSTLEFILKRILDIGIIVLVVLFQPELRRALEKIGRSKLTEIGKKGLSSLGAEDTERLIQSIVEACGSIIKREEGALIVIERSIKLGEIVNTGIEIDAEPSPQLIANIFFKNSPLHDGAMIIRDNRILAAGCYLPLSDNNDIDGEMGTRHRAALGVSEVSDAITVVVSEERGIISITQEGHIITPLTPQKLKKELEKRLIVQEEKDKKSFWKFGENKNDSKQKRVDK